MSVPGSLMWDVEQTPDTYNNNNMKDSIVEKTKERWHGRGCMDNCHVT
jgi:hypothetical protein